MQWSLKSILWWQIVIVPALLSPVQFAIANGQYPPWISFFAFVVPPVCFVAILVVVWPPTMGAGHRSVVFSNMRRGGLYALLFAVLATGPLTVQGAAKRFQPFANVPLSTFRTYPDHYLPWIGQEVLNLVIGVSVVLAFYAIIGAAIGGVAGVTRDVFTRRRSAASPSP